MIIKDQLPITFGASFICYLLIYFQHSLKTQGNIIIDRHLLVTCKNSIRLFIFVNMHFLSTVLALYLSALILFPCYDVVAEEGIHNEVHLHTHNDQAPIDLDADLCSPFCSCHCCHTHVVSAKKANSQDSYPSSLEYNSYAGGLLINPSFSVWHPPKV